MSADKQSVFGHLSCSLHTRLASFYLSDDHSSTCLHGLSWGEETEVICGGRVGQHALCGQNDELRVRTAKKAAVVLLSC